MISMSPSHSSRFFLTAFFLVACFKLASCEIPSAQIACAAGKYSCKSAPAYLRIAVCSACVKSCNACGSASCLRDGAICEKSASGTKRRYIWTEEMKKCVALHYACTNFKGSAVASFDYCFECQSDRGCFILCQGNKWCGTNVAHCLQSMHPPH